MLSFSVLWVTLWEIWLCAPCWHGPGLSVILADSTRFCLCLDLISARCTTARPSSILVTRGHKLSRFLKTVIYEPFIVKLYLGTTLFFLLCQGCGLCRSGRNLALCCSWPVVTTRTHARRSSISLARKQVSVMSFWFHKVNVSLGFSISNSSNSFRSSVLQERGAGGVPSGPLCPLSFCPNRDVQNSLKRQTDWWELNK